MSGAEIAKAHRIQTLAAIHNSACIQKRSDDYQCLISMIYDHSFQVEMGNTIRHQSRCIQRERREALALRSRNDQDWLTQSRALLKVLQRFVQKMQNSEKKGLKKPTLFLRFFKVGLFSFVAIHIQTKSPLYFGSAWLLCAHGHHIVDCPV